LSDDTNDNSASVSTWSLRVDFKNKDQAVNLIHSILADDIDFNFEFMVIVEGSETIYSLIVEGIWSNNLTRVAQMVEDVDFKFK
jgi:hypothetical protein